MRLVVLCWNLHGSPDAARTRARLARVADWIRAPRLGEAKLDAPDVVLLQEVWQPWQQRLLAERLAPEWRPVAIEGRRFPVAESGLLCFLRTGAELELEESRYQRFARAAPAWRLWEGDGLARKGVQLLRLRTRHGPLALANTHLQAEYARRSYTEVRRAQVAELLAASSSVPADVPLLAGGDFNSWPEELAGFLGEASPWRDLTAGLRERGERGTCFARAGGEEWLDYLLSREGHWRVHSEAMGCVRNAAPDDPYSDHHGLHAVLRWERSG